VRSSMARSNTGPTAVVWRTYAEDAARVSAMPVSIRQGDDEPAGRHSSPRPISHCVLDIMEWEEYTQSSPTRNYWPDLGEFCVVHFI
jgi:hypothetical protein